MKDHEIVLKRDRKLIEMKRSINGLGAVNTDGLKRENLNLSIFHELLHGEKERNGILYDIK